MFLISKPTLYQLASYGMAHEWQQAQRYACFGVQFSGADLVMRQTLSNASTSIGRGEKFSHMLMQVGLINKDLCVPLVVDSRSASKYLRVELP